MFAPPVPSAPGAALRCGRLYGAARALALAELAQREERLVVAIAPDIAAQLALERECRFFLDGAPPPLSFPDWETLPYDTASPHGEIVSQRLRALAGLGDRRRGLLLTAAPALLQRLCPPAHVRDGALRLARGDEIEIDALRARLDALGYRACAQVREPGEFAVRGSVVDLFPMGAERPCRLDFLDRALDSLRHFDPERQTSVGATESVEALPGREFPLTPEAIDRFRRNFRNAFDTRPADSPIYRDISDAVVPAGIEYYLPLFFERTASLFDYLPPDALLACWGDPAAAAAEALEEIAARRDARRSDAERPPLPVAALYLDAAELAAGLARHPQWRADRFEREARGGADVYNYPVRPLPELRVRPQNQEPARALRSFLARESRRVLFAAQSPGRREQLRERLAGLELRPAEAAGWEDFLRGDAPLALTVADLDDGFVLPGTGVAVVPEARLFPDRAQQQSRARRRRDPKALLSELGQLQFGSPVVHEDYGVGRYQGLRRLEIDGQEHEFLFLQYAASDRLYVPITELHRITRYSGADPERAPLHSLQGDQWKKVRRRAAERAYDAAAALLEVQARRQAQRDSALARPPDYARFADGFPFDPTPDQAQAIEEVLADLAADAPMDRIVCGDVGFGKTEVGMRAAFVAAFNGLQTAVLAPTTLLAEQHGKTFRDRFSDWPVRVETLSRFHRGREQTAVLAALAAGEVDVLIGTHRLLQDDVAFARLGLVVIDEEQRFGVRHKERLKALRHRANLLTLTATPIPRTLNMSLSGLRDLSLIATAPAHRHAIKTYVARWDETLLREACLRELKRGGQVYVVHNRIAGIEDCAAALRRLVPEAETRVAHGRMRERELETVMRDFYRQRFGILVCTAIIESGIDIPTANTVIVDRADRFGLAQLHQLRGRVGRSHHLAYAYLLCPPPQTLNEDARRRIEAVESMEELGSGFLLATHDLEIRGAGELLGEEQSGQIQQVGFALYQRLLERAVDGLRRGRVPELDKPLEHGPEIEAGLPALIPDSYLPDVYLRLVLYKRIAGAASAAELEELQVEMVDRFGPLPEPARRLFAVTRTKLEVAPLGIRKIELNERGGRVTFREPGPEADALLRLLEAEPDAYRLDPRMRLHFETELPTLEDRLRRAVELARRLAPEAAA